MKERNANTVKFFPHTIPNPQITIEDFLTQSAQDLVTILNKPPSTLYLPYLKLTILDWETRNMSILTLLESKLIRTWRMEVHQEF